MSPQPPGWPGAGARHADALGRGTYRSSGSSRANGCPVSGDDLLPGLGSNEPGEMAHIVRGHRHGISHPRRQDPWAARITSPSSASGGAVGSPAWRAAAHNSAALSITSVVIGA